MPEIERALRIIYGARYVRKYDESKVFLEIVDWLECYNVPIFEEFCEVEYQGLKGQEHHDLTEVFINANENFLKECAEIMHYPHDVSNANKEQFADFLANIMLNERDYAYYEDNILFTYKYLLENAFEAYKDQIYDPQRLQILCYEEGFSSELYLFTGEALLEYCGDDLEKLAMIYHEEYGEVYYEGAIEELPDEIQLFIKLR